MDRISWMKMARWLITAAVVYFLFKFFADYFEEISLVGATIEVGWLFLSFVLSLAGFLVLINASRLLLKQMGWKGGYWSFAQVYLKGNLARYIPGGVWGYAMRYQGGLDIQIPKRLSLYSLFFEVMALVTTGLIMSVGLLSFSSQVSFALSGILLIVLLGGIYKYGDKILYWLSCRLGKPWAAPYESKLTILRLALILSHYVVVWLLWGGSIWLICQGFNILAGYYFIVQSFAFAYTVGYVAVLVPSGIGVREGLMMTHLLRFSSVAAAGLVAIWSRVIISASEVGALGFVFLVNQSRRLFKH